MKLCFLCDLHLPSIENTTHYRFLDKAIAHLKANPPDAILFAGDVTCDGNAFAYFSFVEKMQALKIPFVFIPGNSDLRNKQTCSDIINASSPVYNLLSGVEIFAVNDSDQTIDDDTFSLLEKASPNAVVFMHHPLTDHTPSTRQKLLLWRTTHPLVKVFYAHLHKNQVDGNDVFLGALDPDKAIDECPSITYYDTDSKVITHAFFDAPVPKDFISYLGLSVFNPEKDIILAIEHKLKYLELRPECVSFDRQKLIALVSEWLSSGGKQLSIHLPDIKYENGRVIPDKRFFELIEIAKCVSATRFTLHVPDTCVKTVRAHASALKEIAEFVNETLRCLSKEIILGVENMHVTDGEPTDDNRRFGYTPKECIEFMQTLKSVCPFKVGINLDVGHARNNAPFSKTYQVGTWYQLVGSYAVGYHVHQVLNTPKGFINHAPITNVYGQLISYASFFECWTEGVLNKAPLILEIRANDGYAITLDAFNSAQANLN